ncbi:MAG: hypothetical protein IJ115_08395 [Erysipelotrichaceae bacterium]|nr:hypothetical protein [Erysipelotrichaceae bacterium]
MKKAIITVFVLLLLCGCKAEPEVIIDDNNVPQAETDTEISLAVTKEGADLIIHTVFPEKYQKQYKITENDQNDELTIVPVGVIRFYSYDSDNLNGDFDKNAYVCISGLDTVVKLQSVVGEMPFMDMSSSNGKLIFRFFVDGNVLSHEVNYGKKEVITNTGSFIDEISDFKIGEEYLLGYVVTSSKRIHTDTLDLDALKNRTVVSNSDVYYKVTAITLEWTDGDLNNTIGWRY